MTRLSSLLAVLSLLLVALSPSPAHAQAAAVGRDTSLADMAAALRAGDEAVRRIVERAMAAVELAEARANQQVATAQIRIADLERAITAQSAELEASKQSEAELGIVLDASLAEADRFARDAKVLRDERDMAQAQLDAARMELEDLAAWRDSATRAAVQARRAIAEREELADRLAALHTQFGFSEHALTEARASADALGRAYADSLAAISGENENLRAGISQFQDRIAAYQNRSGVVEESLRQEAARAASWETEIVRLRARLTEQERQITNERTAAVTERRLLDERLGVERAIAADLRQALDAERVKYSGLEARYVELAAIEQSARVSHAQREASSETMARILAERDALRQEIASTVAVLDDAATALASARMERDEARRGGGTGFAVSDLEARLAARDREIAALRSALISVASGSPAPHAPASPSEPPYGPVPQPVTSTTPPRTPVGATTPVGAATSVTPPSAATTAAPVVPPAPDYVFDPIRATYEELAAIPAVGPTRARAIVWYRENVGAIRRENDLKSVPGFNDDRIRLLRPYWRSKED